MHKYCFKNQMNNKHKFKRVVTSFGGNPGGQRRKHLVVHKVADVLVLFFFFECCLHRYLFRYCASYLKHMIHIVS